MHAFASLASLPSYFIHLRILSIKLFFVSAVTWGKEIRCYTFSLQMPVSIGQVESASFAIHPTPIGPSLDLIASSSPVSNKSATEPVPHEP